MTATASSGTNDPADIDSSDRLGREFVRSGELARVVGPHRVDRREPIRPVGPPARDVDDDVSATIRVDADPVRRVGVATTRFGVGKPARALTLDVPGSPAAHGKAVKNPFTGEITVTESAKAVASTGPTALVSITSVQPASSADSTPPVPSRVSTIRSGSIGSYDTRSTSGAASVAGTGRTSPSTGLLPRPDRRSGSRRRPR